MNRRLLREVDWQLFLPTAVLVTLSLTTLFSVKISYFNSQLVYFLASVIVFFFCSHMNINLLRKYSFTTYVIGIVLLLFLLIIGIETRGAVRWIEIFGVSIQISEILKPFFSLTIASFLADREFNLKTFFQVILLSSPVLLLIFLQPDLGTALVYLGAVVLGLIIAGFSYTFFIGGAAFLLLSFPLLWNFFHDYQKQRILTFLNPSSDPLGKSYNAVQAMIAVGSGMFFGKGFSETTQSALRFLPEHHTDFLFATLTEGLGFVGALVIIVAFSYLLFRIFVIFSMISDPFGKLFSIFCFTFLFIQIIVNIGMNIGILPIVGITLPFMSYGGSSLLSNFIFLGILSSIFRHMKKRESHIEIR